METYFGAVWLVRPLIQRAVAAIYLIGFIVVLNQFKPLLGELGLLPVPNFLKRARFRDAPSIFHWKYSDRALNAVAWSGILLSGAALLGISEAGPTWISAATW